MSGETKSVTVTWSASFSEEVEVPAGWSWGGDLDELLELTGGMSFSHPSASLEDCGVEI